MDEHYVRALKDPETVFVANDFYTGYRNNEELIQARTKVHRYSVSECMGYPYSIPLAVGYPYMVAANIDVEGGLVNGAIGILRHIQRLTEDEVFEEQLIHQQQSSTSTQPAAVSST